MWKRCGSDRPQQSAAAWGERSLAEAPERQTAVDRSTCSRLQARGRPFEPGTAHRLQTGSLGTAPRRPL